MANPKNVPQDPENTDSDYDIRMANLRDSDVDVESLLSGGSDIDQLIEAGVLDDEEYFTREQIEQQQRDSFAQRQAEVAHLLRGEYNIVGEL
jgi:hypothetical protein